MDRYTVPLYLALCAAALSLAGAARATVNLGTADQSDGVFSPTTSVNIDLSQATTGTWSDNNAAHAGKGIYDPAKWAVVFKYASVNIPTGVSVTFTNNISHAPVVWLVQGAVNIAGNVKLDGADDITTGALSEPGPGGFNGGAPTTSVEARSAGFGPGGGTDAVGSYQSGSYATAYPAGITYGNSQALPLIGGSGGSGYSVAGFGGGGAGGGAILIASANTITLAGSISAKGGAAATGGGVGSGGAIRLISESIGSPTNGAGSLLAYSGGGDGSKGDGRIRVEADTNTYSGTSSPAAITVGVGTTATIWPANTVPSVTIAQINGIAAPTDPSDTVTADSSRYAQVDDSVQPILVTMNATNVPVDGTWTMVLRVIPFNGPDQKLTATFVTGNLASSVWQATITSPPLNVSALQARVNKTS